MQDPYLQSVLDAIARDALDGDGPRLITVQELRAAGALDVPPGWRESLSAGTESANAEEELPLFAAAKRDASNRERNDADKS